jgi:2-desacetyl-2-hydroxyethyl bacteriochlorophyllide A dehydrogenase
MTMQALVFTDQAEYQLDQRPVPEAREGQVLVRVESCGICGTDLHAPFLMDFIQTPVILGHEFAGVVAAAGPDVDFAEGESVVVNPSAFACGECRACRAGRPNVCQKMMGGETYGLQKDGGMAEYAVIPARNVHRRSSELPAAIAAWTEPLAVAHRGVRQGGVESGHKVAILGAGPIGQLALQLAVRAGAEETLVVETSAFRRTVAKQCGASEALSPGDFDASERFYDVVIDCTGAPPAFNLGLELVDFGGRMVIIGTNTKPVTMEKPGAAQLKEANFLFSLCYRDGVEFAEALELLERNEIDVRPLTSGVLPLDEHEQAFAAMKDSEGAIKFVLSPPGV